MHRIEIRRIYEPASAHDGLRVLVDRIWPRGISREAAAIDHWARDLAPSTDLRKWFHHDRERWEEFQRRYRAELEPHRSALADLLARADSGGMTLLFAARDTRRNHAVVLRDVLMRL